MSRSHRRFALILLFGLLTLVSSAQKRPKIALALSGGAAYGFCQFGALEWLEQHRIPVDGMAGTSGGAIVGAWYATGLELLTENEIDHPSPRTSPKDMKLHGVAETLSHLDLDRLFSSYPDYRHVDMESKDVQRAYPFGPIAGTHSNSLRFTDGIVPGQSLERLFDAISKSFPTEYLYGDPSVEPFDRLPTPFRSVAAQPHGYDLRQWERIVLGSRESLPEAPDYRVSVPDAVRASMAIPYIFTPRYLPPLKRAGAKPVYGLVDGGVKDNYPTDVACDAFRPDVLIGLQIFVDLTPLSDVFMLTGHPKVPSDIARHSNEFKLGSSPAHRPKWFSILMDPDHARPDEFNDWRHLAWLGYRSMDQYAASPGGKRILQLSLSPEKYKEYRAGRRAKLAEAQVAEERGPRREPNLDGLASARGLGSLGTEGRASNVKQREYQRSIGPLQIFSAPSLSAGTADRTLLEDNITLKTFGFGSPLSSLRADLEVGSDFNARIDYRYRPGSGQFYLKPYADSEHGPQSSFSDDKRTATHIMGVQRLGVEAGAYLGTNVQVSARSEIGSLALPGSTGYSENAFQVRFDSTNSELFPTQGLRLDALLHQIRVDDNSQVINQGVVKGDWHAAINSIHSLWLRGRAGTSFGTQVPEPLQFRLGGPAEMQGYPFDYIGANAFSYGSATVALRMEKIPFYIGTVQWLGGIEAAQADNRFLKDAFTGFLFSTRFSQLYLGAAVSDQFRPRLIISIGSQPFRHVEPISFGD